MRSPLNPDFVQQLSVKIRSCWSYLKALQGSMQGAVRSRAYLEGISPLIVDVAAAAALIRVLATVTADAVRVRDQATAPRAVQHLRRGGSQVAVIRLVSDLYARTQEQRDDLCAVGGYRPRWATLLTTDTSKAILYLRIHARGRLW